MSNKRNKKYTGASYELWIDKYMQYFYNVYLYYLLVYLLYKIAHEEVVYIYMLAIIRIIITS